MLLYFFFFKQKTAYEMRISDWSSDVCSSDLFQRNIQAGTSRLGLEENALTTSEDVLQRVRELSLQGINPVLNDGARADIARELQERQIGRASCRERVCKYV